MQVVIIIAVLFKFKYDVQNVQNVLRMYEKTNVLFFSFRDFQFLYLVLSIVPVLLYSYLVLYILIVFSIIQKKYIIIQRAASEVNASPPTL